MNRSRLFRSVLLAVALMAVSDQLEAQSVPHVAGGTIEVGGFVGGSFGSGGKNASGGSRALAGGNFAYAINKFFMPYGEFSYFPGLTREVSQVTVAGGGSTSYTISPAALTDFHGGLHIRLPHKETPVVPYLVIGVGAVRTGTAQVKSSLGNFSLNSETVFAVNGGGGLRWYLGGSERFGLRLEAKIYKPNSGNVYNSAVFGKVEGGFFFQFQPR